MIDIKYDFNSCYDAYDFLQFDNEEVAFEEDQDELHEVNSFYETVEDILKLFLIQCGIDEAPKPAPIVFPDPRKLLKTC